MKSVFSSAFAAIIAILLVLNPPVLSAKEQPADAPKKAPDDKPAAKESILDKKLPEVAFDGVRLGDAIDFFKDIGGAEVVVDWPALKTVGVTEDSVASAKMKNVTVGNALKKIFDGAAKKKGKIAVSVDDDGKIQIGLQKSADKKK